MLAAQRVTLIGIPPPWVRGFPLLKNKLHLRLQEFHHSSPLPPIHLFLWKKPGLQCSSPHSPFHHLPSEGTLKLLNTYHGSQLHKTAKKGGTAHTTTVWFLITTQYWALNNIQTSFYIVNSFILIFESVTCAHKSLDWICTLYATQQQQKVSYLFHIFMETATAISVEISIA